MTDRLARSARWSKAKIRATAWIAGGLAFLVSGAAIGAVPKPPADRAVPRDRHRPAPRPTIVKRRVVRTVVVDPPANSGATGSVVVYTGETGSAGATTSGATTTSSGGTATSSGGTSSGGSSGSGSSSSGGSTTTTGGS